LFIIASKTVEHAFPKRHGSCLQTHRQTQQKNLSKIPKKAKKRGPKKPKRRLSVADEFEGTGKYETAEFKEEKDKHEVAKLEGDKHNVEDFLGGRGQKGKKATCRYPPINDYPSIHLDSIVHERSQIESAKSPFGFQKVKESPINHNKLRRLDFGPPKQSRNE
jgi:hypothetical protein